MNADRDTEWTDFPDADHPGLYWIRWRARYRVNVWHATRDGEVTLCGLGTGPHVLYVGRQFFRCQHCQRAIAKLA